MTDFYSQNRCVCSTRSHGPLLCAFCLSFHFNCSVSVGKPAMRHRKFARRYLYVPAPQIPGTQFPPCHCAVMMTVAKIK